MPIDLLEAYGSYKFPLGSGLTLKAGKFASLLGFEVIEGPLKPELLALHALHLRGFAHARGRAALVLTT